MRILSLIYLALLLLLCAIVLYGIALPGLISSRDTLYVGIGIAVAVLMLPVYGYAFYLLARRAFPRKEQNPQ